MPVATNDQGQALRLEGNQWVPTQMATNPQTQEQVAFDGQAWVPVKTQGATQPQKPSYLMDAVRSVPGAIAKTVSAVAGLPGDISALGDTAFRFATGHTQAEMDAARAKLVQSAPAGFSTLDSRPTSGQIADTISKPFGGMYQPKTAAGRYVDTLLSYAPAALSPGSAMQRIARVVIPSTASEAAGEATQGTSAEPYARAVAGLAGGLAQGVGEGVAAERAASQSFPTTQALKTAAGNSYRTADQAGLVIKGQSFDQAIDGISTSLQGAGFNSRIPPAAQARLYPKASAALETLNAAKGADIGLSDLDKLRQTARVALTSPDQADRRVAHIIIDGIDNFVSGISPSDVVAGNAPQAVSAINNARSLWAKGAKSDVIDRTIQKAQDSSSQYTGAGYENALRVQFRNLSKNQNAMRQFSPDEQDAIRRVSAGGPVENVLRFFGKFSPHGALTTLGAGAAGYAAEGIPGAVATLAAGEAARQGATALTARNARIASETVRSGNPVARQLGRPIVQNGLVAGGLSAQQLNNSYSDQIMSISQGVPAQ